MKKPDSQSSIHFHAPDADVTFLSADAVLFHIHRRNLEANTGAFPPSKSLTPGKRIPLPEMSTTLELLFQFIYPQRHPDLRGLDIEVLSALAEAAEKYEVFTAMAICEIRMRSFIYTHPPEVLAYAARHGYTEILAEAAPAAAKLPLDYVVMRLPQSLVVPWVRYHAQYTALLHSVALTTYRCDCTSYYDSTKFHRGWESISLLLFRKIAMGGVGVLIPGPGVVLAKVERAEGTRMEKADRAKIAGKRRGRGGEHAIVLDRMGDASEEELRGAFAACCAVANSCCVDQVREWGARVEKEAREILGFESFL